MAMVRNDPGLLTYCLLKMEFHKNFGAILDSPSISNESKSYSDCLSIEDFLSLFFVNKDSLPNNF